MTSKTNMTNIKESIKESDLQKPVDAPVEELFKCSRCNFSRLFPITPNNEVLNWFLIIEGKWICKQCRRRNPQ